MQRTILSTLPASIIPALVSILSIGLTTRLLSPGELGRYTLVFGAVMAAQSVLFFAPALATTRFFAAAEAQGAQSGFLAGAYAVFARVALAACVLAVSLALALPSGMVWLGAILLVLRGLVGQNQAVNRARRRLGRYCVVECLHAVLGLGLGLLLFGAGVRGGTALVAGLAAAALVSALVDGAAAASCLRQAADPAVLRRIAAFAWPLALAYVVTGCLQYADRLLVGGLAGTAALGVYGVAYSLVDRPITLLCTSVTTGTFPLAVDAYVAHGPEAGRMQAGRNGAMLIALVLPAALGLALCAPCIAAALTGPAFRAGVASLIPVMAATAFLRGLCAHYIDHAFHLAGRSRAMLAVYAPWAAMSVALSAVLIPRFGMPAAACSALLCQAGAALTGWRVASRVLALWLPGREMAKIGACALAMVAALVVARALPENALGLSFRVASGMAVYGLSAWAFDLGGIKARCGQRLPTRLLFRQTRPPGIWPSAPLPASDQAAPHHAAAPQACP